MFTVYRTSHALWLRRGVSRACAAARTRPRPEGRRAQRSAGARTEPARNQTNQIGLLLPARTPQLHASIRAMIPGSLDHGPGLDNVTPELQSEPRARAQAAGPQRSLLPPLSFAQYPSSLGALAPCGPPFCHEFCVGAAAACGALPMLPDAPMQTPTRVGACAEPAAWEDAPSDLAAKRAAGQWHRTTCLAPAPAPSIEPLADVAPPLRGCFCALPSNLRSAAQRGAAQAARRGSGRRACAGVESSGRA